jgi:hypothetical protein
MGGEGGGCRGAHISLVFNTGAQLTTSCFCMVLYIYVGHIYIGTFFSSPSWEKDSLIDLRQTSAPPPFPLHPILLCVCQCSYSKRMLLASGCFLS